MLRQHYSLRLNPCFPKQNTTEAPSAVVPQVNNELRNASKMGCRSSNPIIEWLLQ